MKASRYWLIMIVAVAFLLRAWNVDSQCLDIDEYTELQVQHQTFAEAANAADSMPPLFPVLLKSCLAVWPHDLTGRWFSIIVGVATVWIVGTLWAQIFGHALALVTAGLLAISPLHIYYSQYTRSYGLMIFWTALVVGFLAQAVQSNRANAWVLFGISALGGLYTHYYFAIFLAVLSPTMAIWAYGWRWSRQWWATHLCVGLLAMPLIAFVGKDLHFQKSLRDSRPLDVASLGYTYVSMMTGYSAGPSKRDLQVMGKREALAAAAPIAIAVGLIFLGLAARSRTVLREQRLFVVLCVLTVVPVIVVGILGHLADVTYNPRFVVWSLMPLLALLAAGTIEQGNSWSGRLAILLLVGVCATALYNRQMVPRYQNEDVRSLGAYLVQQTDNSNEHVAVISNYMVPAVAHYLPAEWQVFELPLVDDTNEMESTTELVPLARKALAANLSGDRPFWLVYTRPFHGDPDGAILEDLSARGKLEKTHEFAGIVLYRCSQIEL